jgi:hypothetical protein
MADIKFGAPLRTNKIVLELSLNVQRGEEGELKISAESKPQVAEDLDWTEGLGLLDTGEAPLPLGFYNFTYSESGGLVFEDLPTELGEERRQQLRVIMRAGLRTHFNELVSLMLHFPDREDLMGMVPALVKAAVAHSMACAATGEGEFDEGVQTRVIAVFDPAEFGEVVASNGECSLVQVQCIDHGPYLMNVAVYDQGASSIQLTIATPSIYRKWVASHLQQQVEALVAELLPGAIEVQINEVEKSQGLIDQITAAWRRSISR